MYRILIVEDDDTIARTVQKELTGWGYEVEVVEELSDVMAHFRRFDPQLVLLDLALPFRSGYHWCAQIRLESKVPVVFLSSSGDNMSQVMAIHQGADDFIPKPFDMAVLTAKVGAILRRSYEFGGEEASLSHRGAVLVAADATLCFEGHRIELTRNELRILETLLASKGRVVSRDTLMRRLWESESFIDDNTLTVNVTRLRKKLADEGLEGFIETKKGLGYIIPL